MGTARPVTAELACGLMLIAIEGAISASETPTADHTVRRRDSRGSARALSSTRNRLTVD